MSGNESLLLDRPRRWDSPFDPAMSEGDVDGLLERPEFAAIDATRFSSAAPLRGILRNDCRIVVYKPGEIIVVNFLDFRKRVEIVKFHILI